MIDGLRRENKNRWTGPFIWGHTILFTVFFYWMVSNRTWDFDALSFETSFGGNFYWEQAQSILRGHLYIDTFGFECMEISGRCHGYFGPTPSILRLPVVAFFGDTYLGFTPLFTSLAAAISLFAMLNLFSNMTTNIVSSVSRSFYLISFNIVALSLGATSVLMLSAQPRVYEEAILWSAAFVAISLNLTYRWYFNRQPKYLVFLIISLSLGVLSRGTVLPFAGLLALFFTIEALRNRKLKQAVLRTLIVVVPFTAFAIYSFANAGTLGSRYDNYWPYNNILIFRNVIEANNGSVLGPQFFPTTLFHYINIDKVDFSFSIPWVSLSPDWYSKSVFVAPIDSSRMLIGYNPGLTVTIAAFFIASLYGLWLAFKNTRSNWRTDDSLVLACLVTASGASALMAMSWFSITARYATDLYPFLAITSLIAVRQLCIYSNRNHTGARIVLGLLSLSAIHSLVTFLILQEEMIPFL